MEQREAEERLAALPIVPRRRSTRADKVMIVVVMMGAYVSGALAAFGSVVGLMCAGLTAVLLLWSWSDRVARPDEPKVPVLVRWTAVFAGVFAVSTAWSLWRNSDQVSGEWLWPITAVGVCIAHFALVKLAR